MSPPAVLVIDDQYGRTLAARRSLCVWLGLQDLTGDDESSQAIPDALATACFTSAQHRRGDRLENDVLVALEAARSGWPSARGGRWALALLDLRFTSGSLDDDGDPLGRPGDEVFGLRILEALKREMPRLPVVVLSSRDRREVIEDCRRLGAADFIQRHAVGESRSIRETLAAKLREYGLVEDRNRRIVGRSLPLLEVLAGARRAATGAGNVLVLGETGTGKELLARYLHDECPNGGGPYKVFHAFGTAESLQEDLLFGHVRGAFTDAKDERAGLFELASGGTLFIDEIADIPPSLQAKLLRPIEAREVSRQGSDSPSAVRLQVILATNKPVERYARAGLLKEDLLNRIRAYVLTLPPLRERTEDIPLLVDHLLEVLCREHGARWPREVDSDAMSVLVQRDWRDGNVRELRNVLERAVKDNKESELLVVPDLRFDESLDARAESAGDATRFEPQLPGETQSFPRDYASLAGTWPRTARTIGRLLGTYLAAALEATRRTAPDGRSELNLAGAIGCILGRRVSSAEAADFLKRLIRLDEAVMAEMVREHPPLQEALARALQIRPKTSSAPRGEAR